MTTQISYIRALDVTRQDGCCDLSCAKKDVAFFCSAENALIMNMFSLRSCAWLLLGVGFLKLIKSFSRKLDIVVFKLWYDNIQINSEKSAFKISEEPCSVVMPYS